MAEVIYDVVIAGAGPVGLFLAGELALAECKVLVLEKSPSPVSPLKQMPFGIRGLNLPSIEALDRRGLLDQLRVHRQLKNPHQTAGAPARIRRQVGHFAGLPLFEDLIDESHLPARLDNSPPNHLISTVEEIETICARRAEDLGVRILRGCAVEEVGQSEEAVTVRAGGPTYAAKYVVGCDGGRSVIRKGGGFTFEGTEPEFTGYSLELELEDGPVITPGRHFTDRGMYMQSQPGYLVVADFDGGAGHKPEVPLGRERVEDLLRGVSGLDLRVRRVGVGSTWTDRAKQVTEYRRGRVLLAGDAAHIHSPLGGQGLNLGLGDAMNLGWKLAAEIKGRAPRELLDTYHAERHPVGSSVLAWSRAQVSIMRPDPAARAMNAIVRDLLATRDGATYVASRIWGVDTSYPRGEDAHPLLGRSVPNYTLADGSTVAEVLRRGRGLVIEFGEAGAMMSEAKRLGLIHVRGRREENENLKAVSVRPDGYINRAFSIDAFVTS